MATLTDIANSMAAMEGDNVTGSLAQRNNNPGNLRFANQIGAVGQDANGFAIFATPDDGMNALISQLGLYAGRGMTLAQAINVYAPASDSNDPSSYISFVSGQTGISADSLLSSFPRG